MQIGDALRAQQKAQGLSQRDLGDRFGVDQTTVSRWVRGKQAPERHLWPDLADFLGLELGELTTMLLASSPEARLDRLEAQVDELRQLVGELVEALERGR